MVSEWISFRLPEVDFDKLYPVPNIVGLCFQTMLNIYAEQQGVEELLGATDLQSLITATASLWDQGSPLWKGPTSHVLHTISKAQSQNTISYLQGNSHHYWPLCH